MANTFKNFGATLTASGVAIYTCPANTTAIVLHCQAANVDATTTVSVYWTDDSDGDAITYLAKVVSVPAGTSLSVLTGKLVLEAGDTITALCGVASDIDLSGSVLEIS